MMALIPFCFVTIIVGFIALVWYLDQDRVDPIKAAWKEFAKSNQLSFSYEPHISGLYQDFSLWIDTTVEDRNIYTRLRLTKPLPSVLEQKFFNAEEIQNKITALMSVKFPALHSGCRLYLHLANQSTTYIYSGIERNTGTFQRLFDPLTRLLEAYLAVGIIGGEVIPFLEEHIQKEQIFLHKLNTHPLRNIATQLLKDIGSVTTIRLAHQSKMLLCSRCLTYCHAHKVKLSWSNTITYYGCRVCHQSRNFFKGSAIAMLDNKMPTERFEQGDIMQVNWLKQRQLFDFDAVHILNATDEDVERFAVQVGNDTDEIRKSGYAKMCCAVAPECELSLNTIRILERTFGEVVVRHLQGNN